MSTWKWSFLFVREKKLSLLANKFQAFVPVAYCWNFDNFGFEKSSRAGRRGSSSSSTPWRPDSIPLTSRCYSAIRKSTHPNCMTHYDSSKKQNLIGWFYPPMSQNSFSHLIWNLLQRNERISHERRGRKNSHRQVSLTDTTVAFDIFV